jgi:hypothetical protein
VPRLSCWFIRAALAHLAVGVVFGGLILSAKGLPGALGWSWLLLAAHMQLLVGGWLVQLALGMAYWIFPRLDAEGTRGRTYAATFSCVALNLGVGSAALLLTVRGWYAVAWLELLLIPAALLQAAALVAFAYHAWPRVRTTIVAK